MILPQLFLILLIALLISAIFAAGFGRPGPWGGFLWFFLVVFLATWALAAWITPIGPTLWGIAWIPLLIGALLIGLLIAAATPPRPLPTTRETPDDATGAEIVAAGTLGAFFWVLLLALLVAAVAAYV